MTLERITNEINGYLDPYKALMPLEIKRVPDMTGEVISTLKENDVIDYLGERYYDIDFKVVWYKIKTTDGSVGWCFIEYPKQNIIKRKQRQEEKILKRKQRLEEISQYKKCHNKYMSLFLMFFLVLYGRGIYNLIINYYDVDIFLFTVLDDLLVFIGVILLFCWIKMGFWLIIIVSLLKIIFYAVFAGSPNSMAILTIVIIFLVLLIPNKEGIRPWKLLR